MDFQPIESAEEFRQLRHSQSESDQSRATWAAAPTPVWLEVIQRWPDLAFWVAHNKSVPVDILRILSLHADSNVRGMVARKRKAPSDTLTLLASDPDESVRAAVAANKTSPKALVQTLLQDQSWVVRQAAAAKLGASK